MGKLKSNREFYSMNIRLKGPQCFFFVIIITVLPLSQIIIFLLAAKLLTFEKPMFESYQKLITVKVTNYDEINIKY